MSTSTRPQSRLLSLPDNREILDIPLEGFTLYQFTGEAQYGELCFDRGQRVLVFCEDMTEGWSLAMLVDDDGRELVLQGTDADGRLTRGLLPQGFVEYISRPGTNNDATRSGEETAPPTEVLPPVTLEQASLPDISPAEATSATSSEEPPTPQPDVQGLAVEDEPDTPPSVDQSGDDASEGDSTAQIALQTLAEPRLLAIQEPVPEELPPASAEGERHARPLSTLDEEVEGDVAAQLEDPGSESGPDHAQASAYAGSCAAPESLPKPASAQAGSPSQSSAAPRVTILPPPSSSSTGTAPARQRQASSSFLLGGSKPRPRNAVEAFILGAGGPSSLSRASFSEREQHSIEDGRWVSKIPYFHVAVPSYQQKAVAGSRGGEYTIFRIVSSVPLPPSTVANRASAGSGRASDNIEKEDDNDPELQYKQITVERRYTHFQHLHTVLRTSLPLVSVPDLPEKRLTGNFTKDFLDVRRRDLERFLRRLACHPLVRSHRTFLDFLGNEDEQAFDSSLPNALLKALSAEPDAFFTRVTHESDHFDEAQLLDEATETSDSFSMHVRAIEKGSGVVAVQDSLKGYREGMRGTGIAMRNFAFALQRLVAGQAQPPDLPHSLTADDADEPTDPTRRLRHRARLHKMQNEDGAFCWKDACADCLSTSKAVQAATEAMSTVSNLYEANATAVLLPPQELLVEWSLPRQRYKKLLDNLDSAQKKLELALSSDDAEEEEPAVIARCETALCATLAEIEQVHDERQADLRTATVSLLDGQIAFHEHALAQLQAARNHFHSPLYEDLATQGSRLPSLLEKARAEETLPPLRDPSAFGLPPLAGATSSVLKPISLLGEVLAGAAGSVLGWRSASSAIRAQQGAGAAAGQSKVATLSSPNLASSRFVQFLDWTINNRGEKRESH